ncbi:peptide chain release factor 2 [Rhodomicrobium sp. Az07]|uniref:peptide chain release factor 2 n=1 Tax=Rhodomicrobium sp. Az07 TaxID=2839034 RepID=UPI001BEA698E|nr:peptide chain release factor 2 [Rhodomicrobium sp. Az07]MBT3071973.1 peptide chain release factor 2 [Rhodomicrobium sp. Az07]
MRPETQAIVDEIKQSLSLLRRYLDWDKAKARLASLNEIVEDPTLWDNPQRAQKLLRERQHLDTALTAYSQLAARLDDAVGLIELGEEEGDDEVVNEAEASLAALQTEVQKREVEALLSGEADGNDTFLEVHAGAGGTESQDWTEMLLRMYMRWAEEQGYKVELIESAAGEEAGLKSATIQVKGSNAFGWLKTESGVHRLVRISPYDSNARRHTSFASVWVYPVVDETIDIAVAESDCRIDTYRASGAGGQHVNTTDSAVRITHVPTGIVVQCQMERSQHKNRATAWNMLKARLYEMELKKREDAAHAAAASKTEIGWGHQIRSYVLQPYQMVKDLRTGIVNTNPAAVLDGDITAFIEAALAQRVHGGGPAKIEDLD